MKQTTSLYTDRVVQGSDGKYRWYYRVNLLRNYSILLHVWRVLLLIVGIGWPILLALRLLISRHNNFKFADELLTFGLLLLIAWAVGLLGYIIYACKYGYYFTSCYAMDEKQIYQQFTPQHVHSTKQPEGFKAILEALTSRPGMPGFGVVRVSGKWTDTTPLQRVIRMKERRGLHHIKVSLGIDSTRIFIPDEDFDMVRDFLRQHCQNVKK